MASNAALLLLLLLLQARSGTPVGYTTRWRSLSGLWMVQVEAEGA
jgi:hypothetical protein